MPGGGQQALLILAHLRNGDTYARLAVGFGIRTTMARRYIRESVDLFAATAPTLAQAMRRIRRLAYVILDSTLISIDRIQGAAHYCGKPSATASTSRSSPTRPDG